MRWHQDPPSYTETISIFEACQLHKGDKGNASFQDIYAEWISTFNNKFNQSSGIHLDQLTTEFYDWQKDFPEIRSGLIHKILVEDFEVESKNHFLYLPKNTFVRDELDAKFKKNHRSKLTIFSVSESILDSGSQPDVTNKLVVSGSKASYFIERKSDGFWISREPRLGVTLASLNRWLLSMGIVICGTTGMHLWEFGLPYNNGLIKISEMMEYSSRTYGLLGALAHSIVALRAVQKSQNGSFDISTAKEYHPLCQSVVVALANLEWHINPLR